MPTPHRLIGCIAGGLGAAMLSLSAIAAEPAWVAKSNDNARLLLDINAKYNPEDAGALGVEGVDERIVDLSRDRYGERSADLRGAVAELRKRLKAEPNVRVRQDLDILITRATDQLESRRLDRKYFMPYYDLTGQLFSVMRDQLDPRVAPARQKALLVRLEKYAGMAKGYRPITQLAQERLRERLKANPMLIGPYKGSVEQAINDGPTLLKGMRELLVKSGLKGWETSFGQLERQLTAYNAYLQTDLLPRARRDHRLPPEVYANSLHEYGVDVSPQDLVAKALTAFAEIRNQMQITAGLVARERGFADPDYRAVIAELKKQQIPADKVMPLYAERLAAIEAAARAQHIVSLPERKAVIRLASMAENAQQPAPHMNPPRMIGNTGEYGEFILTTGMPPDASGKRLEFDDFTHQAATWTLTAHEARPGHELQFSRMIETGVSTARAVFADNSVNVEGWALYAEAEMQPFEPLDGQLLALQARQLRAARAFLDPMVNLGEITPDKVKSFLMDEVGMSEGMATQEMQRYTFRAPGQATAYFYGYQRLMETRQAAEVVLRKKFNRQAFNDFVLDQGLLPPKLMRKAVMEEFVPAQLNRP